MIVQSNTTSQQLKAALRLTVWVWKQKMRGPGCNIYMRLSCQTKNPSWWCQYLPKGLQSLLRHPGPDWLELCYSLAQFCLSIVLFSSRLPESALYKWICITPNRVTHIHTHRYAHRTMQAWNTIKYRKSKTNKSISNTNSSNSHSLIADKTANVSIL